MLKICSYGNYAHRQPLAYPQIRAHCLHGIQLTDRPEAADIVTLAHPKDLQTFGAELRATLSPAQRLVLLSEEPFWDTLWGKDPLNRQQLCETPAGPLPFTLLNHVTSEIFAFDEIPYFLLTDHHFSTRYALWFRRNAALTARDWGVHFHRPLLQAAFVMKFRLDPFYEASFARGAVTSLCNRRTQIAQACQGPGFQRDGEGWGEVPPRQSLLDWHLDKFLLYNRRCRFFSAIENTHLARYVTEKLFDAYAIGAIPLYIAQPGHRVHDLALPGSWVNLHDIPPSEVPALLAHRAEAIDPETLEIYAAQQRRLAQLFDDPAPLLRELARLQAALLAEFLRVLDTP